MFIKYPDEPTFLDEKSNLSGNLEKDYSQYSLCFSMSVSSLLRQLAKKFLKVTLGMASVVP
jgi:hypothetical protein